MVMITCERMEEGNTSICTKSRGCLGWILWLSTSAAMLTQFFRLVTLINDGDTTLDDAAAMLSDFMTDDEHLALLQGNRSLTQHLSDNKASPYPASVVSRVGVPGLHFVDGAKQSFFTEFPSPLGRAASFNCQLEELIVSVLVEAGYCLD
jgi:hypothetical protein